MKTGKFKSFSISCVILVIVASARFVDAGSKLVVEGNVLGYDLYLIRPTSYPGLLYPVLFKVTKVIKGDEKSSYILVWFENLKRDFAIREFGLNKISSFTLERQTSCKRKIKSLMYKGRTLDDLGRIIEADQTFTLVPGIDKKSLPLEKKIPCYMMYPEK